MHSLDAPPVTEWVRGGLHVNAGVISPRGRARVPGRNGRVILSLSAQLLIVAIDHLIERFGPGRRTSAHY